MTNCNPNTFNVKDASLSNAVSLPNGNAAVVNSPAFDLQSLSTAALLAPCEVLLEAPALTVSELPNAATITYTVQMDTTTAFGSATTIGTLGVQTGAAGAGSAAIVKRFRPPTDVERYLRVTATNSATVGDASASQFVASIVA